MNLSDYDIILVNTSAGKDSLAMLDHVCSLAIEQNVLDRVRAVHCDLGRMEWQGTRELAERQCARYDVPLHVISRTQDLLDHVCQRRMWPSSKARYCTSDHKRGQVDKVITRLVNEWIDAHHYETPRVLNCLGLRAQESAARKKKPPFERNERASNGKRAVYTWLPIHDWTETQVWAHIRTRGLEYHYAYDLGMPRLSCVFCIFAPVEALKLAGFHNRSLLDQYVAVERAIGHDFQHKKPLVQIQAALNNGYTPTRIESSQWTQCA